MEAAKTSSGHRRISSGYQTKVFQIISFYQKNGFYPYPRNPGRKPRLISDETEALVLTAYDSYSLGPTLLEKKIEKEYDLHIPHNTLYRILCIMIGWSPQ